MGLSREERTEARRVVERAVAAQAALDAALAVHKSATAELVYAKDEHQKALAAFREYASRNSFAVVVGGQVAVTAGERLELRPLQPVDEPTPQPEPEPVQVKPPQQSNKRAK